LLVFIAVILKNAAMDLTQLSSKDLQAIAQLLAKKEALQEQIKQIDQRLTSLARGKGQAARRASGRGHGVTGRGELKEAIIGALKTAGKEGMAVKDIAAKTGVKSANVFSWFYATGKKVKGIKKVGEARYAFV
jgi:hypothetical protein